MLLLGLAVVPLLGRVVVLFGLTVVLFFGLVVVLLGLVVVLLGLVVVLAGLTVVVLLFFGLVVFVGLTYSELERVGRLELAGV